MISSSRVEWQRANQRDGVHKESEDCDRNEEDLTLWLTSMPNASFADIDRLLPRETDENESKRSSEAVGSGGGARGRDDITVLPPSSSSSSSSSSSTSTTSSNISSSSSSSDSNSDSARAPRTGLAAKVEKELYGLIRQAFPKGENGTKEEVMLACLVCPPSYAVVTISPTPCWQAGHLPPFRLSRSAL